MRLPFRQGIVLSPSNIITKTGDTFSIIIPGGEQILATVADGPTNYLITELLDVNNAWIGPFELDKTYWLYWNIDTTSGAKTYGYTKLKPFVANVPPLLPEHDQHWFDTGRNTMFVFNSINGRWMRCIRVFAAQVEGGSIVTSVSVNSPLFIGTQVGDEVPSLAGNIVFDANGNVLLKGNGTFFTTEDVASVSNALGARIKFEATILSAVTDAHMAAYTFVRLDADGKVIPANNNLVDSGLYGIIEQSALRGDTVNVIHSGVVTNTDWNWTGVGASINDLVYTTTTGVITTVTQPAPPVGIIINNNSIVLVNTLQTGVAYSATETITSVGISTSTPAGVIINNSPITSSGTIGVSLTGNMEILSNLTSDCLVGINSSGVLQPHTISSYNNTIVTNKTDGAISLSLPTVGTAGMYTSVTTDEYGRVTFGSNDPTDWSTITNTPTTLNGYSITDAVPLSAVGNVNGVAPLDYTLQIPEAFVKSDILEYDHATSFPTTGQLAKIYVALDTKLLYRWNNVTSVYDALTIPPVIPADLVTSVNGMVGDVVIPPPVIPADLVTSVNGMVGDVVIPPPVIPADLVTSVNGMVGDVQVEVPVTSVNEMTGDVHITIPVTSVNSMTGDVNINIPVTSVNTMTGDVVIDNIAFVFQVGGVAEDGSSHSHYALMTVSQAEYLIHNTDVTIPPVQDPQVNVMINTNLSSSTGTPPLHYHTIAVYYDYVNATFVVTDILDNTTDNHTAALVGRDNITTVNGMTGDVWIDAPVTTVNGMTGDVQIATSGTKHFIASVTRIIADGNSGTPQNPTYILHAEHGFPGSPHMVQVYDEGAMFQPDDAWFTEDGGDPELNAVHVDITSYIVNNFVDVGSGDGVRIHIVVSQITHMVMNLFEEA